jgi:hypothetical protein
MSNFTAHKQRVVRPAVFKPFQQEIDRVPRQFCDYMNEENCRFSEICKLYLEGLSMDDVRFLKPEDLITLVPRDHYKHRLLMTIMVRRYLYRPEECETICCKPCKTDTIDSDNKSIDSRQSDSRQSDSRQSDSRSTDSRSTDSCQSDGRQSDKHTTDTKCMYVRQPKPEFSCDRCDHVCTNSECDHSCEDYRIVRQTK